MSGSHDTSAPSQSLIESLRLFSKMPQTMQHKLSVTSLPPEVSELLSDSRNSFKLREQFEEPSAPSGRESASWYLPVSGRPSELPSSSHSTGTMCFCPACTLMLANGSL